MHSYLRILFFWGILLSITSCDEPESPFGDPMDNSQDFEVVKIIPNGDENYLNEDADYIFDHDKLLSYHLNIPISDYIKINNNPTAEEYVEGNLIFEGDTLSPVGIRYKGSIGAFVGCVSGINWAQPSGYKTCTKLSMKVKINWDDSDDKFFGLKKLQFHSMNNDPSQMRERLGYQLYRDMGVPAPRAVHAKLYINQKFIGIFALIEQIDGRFTRHNFEKGKGNLYKEIWPLTDKGLPHSDAMYLAALKTNEDENPSTELIKTFAQEVADAEEEDLKTVISKWMDIDKTLALAVVDRTIRVDDGPFHWYCNGNECSSHNFYWYEEPENNKLYLIPWDLDNSFQNIITNSNPVTPIADDWGETRNNCEPFSFGAFGFRQKSAACDKLTRGWTLFEEEYDALLSTFKSDYLAANYINGLLDDWEAQIAEATNDADELYEDATSIPEWQSAMDELKEQLAFAKNQ